MIYKRGLMQKVSFSEQVSLWSKVALHSFGGPAGQIAVIHKLVVEDKKLISEERFLHALNFCMLLPGPEAQQLATYMGWLMGKWRGGLIAGGLFILPGFLSILALSYLYVIFNNVPFVQGLFYGMKPAIIAIVVGSLLKISKKSLTHNYYWFTAIFAFVGLFFFNLSFPVVVFLSALSGICFGKFYAHQDLISHERVPLPSFIQTFKTISVWLAVWCAPIVLTILIFGTESTFHSINFFFSKMSMVTFGGAYAALTYVAQRAVEGFGWLSAAEMIDGLAMAETTPGPLIQTVQFVGFMGAFRFSDMASPYLSALIGSVLTTWVTFAPCFLWIFTFAPYIEFIRGQKIFSYALKSITAAVVGVIFNLSLWFALKTLFGESKKMEYMILDFEYPVLNSIDWWASAICLVAIMLQFKFKQSLFRILGVCTFMGIVIRLFFYQ